MKWLVLAVFALVPCVHCQTEAWCYSEPTCNASTWSVTFPAFCNGTRQSPINIVSVSAKANSNLTAFTFQNFNNPSALMDMENIHNTVRVNLASSVRISGGDLSEAYDSLQFHLHWGNGSSIPGSEHTVDGTRYPMELHIVNTKASYNRNTTLASGDPTGIAALGFLIDVMPGNATGQPEAWRNLTSYLVNITNNGDTVALKPGISLDDLLVGVNRTKYYRYLGSLTTPNCNEAVVWTVFKEPIKVSKDLIDLFSTTVHVSNSSSPFLTNTYRNTQPAQPVTTQPTSGSSTFSTCFSLVPMALGLTLGRAWN